MGHEAGFAVDTAIGALVALLNANLNDFVFRLVFYLIQSVKSTVMQRTVALESTVDSRLTSGLSHQVPVTK